MEISGTVLILIVIAAAVFLCARGCGQGCGRGCGRNRDARDT